MVDEGNSDCSHGKHDQGPDPLVANLERVLLTWNGVFEAFESPEGKDADNEDDQADGPEV
jgi:hypothetical protein